MSVQLVKKDTAPAAIDYYLENTIHDKVDPSGYYVRAGYPAGVWMGKGVNAFGINPGTIADTTQVRRLMSQLRDPLSARSLAPGRIEYEHGDAPAKGMGGRTVIGFWDLTFTVPKSVSVIWAAGDERTRRTIEACHTQAIQSTLDWAERNIALTRTGRGGVLQERVRGLNAVRFQHYESRDGDPHLHSHLVVSNLAQRADGTWGTLDGRTLMSWTVAMSERHDNLMRDMLSARLGIDFEERDGVRADPDSKALIMEATGVPTALIEALSKRALAVESETQRRTDMLEKVRGRALTDAEKAGIHHDAWQATRRAKPDSARPLDETIEDWQQEMRQLGYEPSSVAAAATGHPAQPGASPETINADSDLSALFNRLMNGQLTDQEASEQTTQTSEAEDGSMSGKEHDPAAWIVAQTAEHATTFSRASIEATAQRLTALIRMEDPEARDRLVRHLADEAISRCERVRPERYRLTESMREDPRLAVFDERLGADQPTLQRYYTKELAQAEQDLIRRWKTSGNRPAPTQETRERMRALFHEYSASAKHPLSADQERAAATILTGTGPMRGMVGPAGTGKTTTMRAVKHVIDRLYGKGLIVGVGASARAAGELQESLGITTCTVDKLLDELNTGREHARHRRLAERMTRALRDGMDPFTLRSLRMKLAEQATVASRLSLPQGGYLIIDEASMVSTRQAAQLARACQERDATIIAVGDPRQLDAVGEGGGWLDWADRKGMLPRLDQAHRFSNPEEAKASLLMRDCHSTAEREQAIDAYIRLGLIHPVIQDGEHTVFDQAADDMIQDLREGRSHIINAGSNRLVDDINRTLTLRRQAMGEVDANPDRRIPLMDGLDAGAGDLVATRLNDRTIRASDGMRIRNNDQWKVLETSTDTTLMERTDGTNATVRIPNQWLKDNAQLGYAITSHRSQGATVDECSNIQSLDSTSDHAGLYVGITRGRVRNNLYVEVPNPDSLRNTDPARLERLRQQRRTRLENEGRTYWDGRGQRPEHAWTRADLEPDMMDLARDRLLDILSRDPEGRLAGEQAQAARIDAHDPARLIEERRRLLTMLTQPRLVETLNDAHDPNYVQSIQTSPHFDRLATTWHTAWALDPDTAERIITERTPTPQARPSEVEEFAVLA